MDNRQAGGVICVAAGVGLMLAANPKIPMGGRLFPWQPWTNPWPAIKDSVSADIKKYLNDALIWEKKQKWTLITDRFHAVTYFYPFGAMGQSFEFSELGINDYDAYIEKFSIPYNDWNFQYRFVKDWNFLWMQPDTKTGWLYNAGGTEVRPPSLITSILTLGIANIPSILVAFYNTSTWALYWDGLRLYHDALSWLITEINKYFP